MDRGLETEMRDEKDREKGNVSDKKKKGERGLKVYKWCWAGEKGDDMR